MNFYKFLCFLLIFSLPHGALGSVITKKTAEWLPATNTPETNAQRNADLGKLVAVTATALLPKLHPEIAHHTGTTAVEHNYMGHLTTATLTEQEEAEESARILWELAKQDAPGVAQVNDWLHEKIDEGTPPQAQSTPMLSWRSGYFTAPSPAVSHMMVNAFVPKSYLDVGTTLIPGGLGLTTAKTAAKTAVKAIPKAAPKLVAKPSVFHRLTTQKPTLALPKPKPQTTAPAPKPKIVSNPSQGPPKVAEFEAKHGKKAIQNMSTQEVAQTLANRADRKIPGTGPLVGQKKHKYAEKLLKEYQKKTGERLELTIEKKYIKNRDWLEGDGLKGSIKPDLYEENAHKAFDYKFGEAKLESNQIHRYQQTLPKTEDGFFSDVIQIKPTPPQQPPQ